MTTAPEEGAERVPDPVDWKRNLAALWFAEFTAIFGFSFAFPFVPLFLRQLGVYDPSRLAIWTGVTTGASGLALAVMSPLWGVLADRYGRKPMLVRAMVAGAVAVGLMGFARGPVDLVVLRLLQGASSGTVSAATALVATGTPRQRVGWSLGLLSSAIAVGNALGPSLGGLAASRLGLRAVFWTGGALLAVAVVPVLIVVREAPRARVSESRTPLREVLASAGPGTVAAITALVVCQGLLQTAYSGFQPLLVLRLIDVLPSQATSATGMAFAASGLAAAAAAVAYAGLARRYGYRAVAAVSATCLAASQVLAGFGPGAAALVVGAALAGAFYGAAGPAVSSMIGLEAPASVQARVFGFSSSATAVGFALGPFGGGLVAARYGPPPAMAATAMLALVLMAALALRVREPSR